RCMISTGASSPRSWPANARKRWSCSPGISNKAAMSAWPSMGPPIVSAAFGPDLMKRVPLAFLALAWLIPLTGSSDEPIEKDGQILVTPKPFIEPALLDYSHAVYMQAADAPLLEQKAASV